MFAETRSQQAMQIVRALAGMPGSTSVKITSKAFARIGPAERGTTYQEYTRSFESRGIPMKRVPVMPNAEEVIITAEGELPPSYCEEDLKRDLASAMDSTGARGWEARARFVHRKASRPDYVLTVFTL